MGRAISPNTGRIPTNQTEAMALRLKNGLRETRAELDRDFDDVLTKIDQIMATELLSFDKVKQNIEARQAADYSTYDLNDYAAVHQGIP